jgi:hypothetical protein
MAMSVAIPQRTKRFYPPFELRILKDSIIQEMMLLLQRKSKIWQVLIQQKPLQKAEN